MDLDPGNDRDGDHLHRGQRLDLTTFDTTLAVYTGNSLPSLQTVAFDDDSGTGRRSSVTFPVNGGTTYRIKVDGFAAANGLLNLHIENGPPPHLRWRHRQPRGDRRQRLDPRHRGQRRHRRR